MAFEVPVDDWDGDVTRPNSGKYHVSVIRVEEEGGQRGEMLVDYEVLAGTTPKQEGMVHRDYFSKSAKALKRIHKFAIAVGMITADELDAMKERNEYPTYNFEEDAVGRQLCVELAEETYQGRTSVKCGFGMFRVDDPKVDQWPKHQALLSRCGYEIDKSMASSSDQAPFDSQGGQSVAVEDDDFLDGVV